MKIIRLVLLFSFVSLSLTQKTRRTNDDGSGGRIVGGMDVRIEEAPYQASLMYFGYHICGGAIISESCIVTAAHCKKKNYKKL